MNATTEAATVTNFKCPLCDSLMKSLPGSQMNRADGVTIYCNAPQCPANENVFGHGRNVAQAYEIAKEKFKRTK